MFKRIFKFIKNAFEQEVSASINPADRRVIEQNDDRRIKKVVRHELTARVLAEVSRRSAHVITERDGMYVVETRVWSADIEALGNTNFDLTTDLNAYVEDYIEFEVISVSKPYKTEAGARKAMKKETT